MAAVTMYKMEGLAKQTQSLTDLNFLIILMEFQLLEGILLEMTFLLQDWQVFLTLRFTNFIMYLNNNIFQVSTEWTEIREHLPDNRFTTILMAMGQFIDHDLAHSPVFERKRGNNREIDCCPSNRFNPLQSNSSVCATIGIPSNDKFFSGSKSCMNFVRFVKFTL